MKSQDARRWICGQKLGKFRKAAFESKGRTTVGGLMTNRHVSNCVFSREGDHVLSHGEYGESSAECKDQFIKT